MTGTIHVGIGGWTYEPWRNNFYPADLTQKRELEYASRHVTAIEINGTYYGLYATEDHVGHKLVKEFFRDNSGGNMFKGGQPPDQNRKPTLNQPARRTDHEPLAF